MITDINIISVYEQIQKLDLQKKIPGYLKALEDQMFFLKTVHLYNT